MRINYLLSAYRRLEHASNRQMTAAHMAALEEAISDIQLLGSPEQVKLADAFAHEFAANQEAKTDPLLNDLRASLRRELQLEPVPGNRVRLRLSGGDASQDGPHVSDSARARYEEEAVATETSVNAAVAPLNLNVHNLSSSKTRPFVTDDLQQFADDMKELALRRPPLDVLAACEERLRQELQDLLSRSDVDSDGVERTTDLASTAYDNQLINETTREGVRGIAIMHWLAELDSDRLDERDVQQYVALVQGLLLALRLPPRTRLADA